MRALLLSPALALVLAAPAQAWHCPRASKGPPVSAAQIGKSVWACDRRTGRGTRLARAREIADVDFEGRRVAWTHVTQRRVVLHEAVVGRRVRIVARRTLARATGEVAVSSRGDLAWETRRGIVIKPFDAAPRWIHRRGDLGFEDGGTLRIGPTDSTYVDLRPPPMRDGCPRRERFAPAAKSDAVLVTSASYGSFEGPGVVQVVRGCVRGTGRDRVVAESLPSAIFQASDSFYVGGIDRHWIVLVEVQSSRTDSSDIVRTVEAATGAAGRRAGEAVSQGSLAPSPGDPVAVTEHGVAAWIKAGKVLAAGADGFYATLDSGSVASLRADGTRVTWTNAGEPRSADLG